MSCFGQLGPHTYLKYVAVQDRSKNKIICWVLLKQIVEEVQDGVSILNHLFINMKKRRVDEEITTMVCEEKLLDIRVYLLLVRITCVHVE